MSAARRRVAGGVGLVTLAALVTALADLTQNRPDPVLDGSRTTVTFDVRTRAVDRGERSAAAALWAVCAGTVGGVVSTVPVADGGRWVVTVEPAIGEHGENRLVGCLEDLTIDRAVGDVHHVVSACIPCTG